MSVTAAKRFIYKVKENKDLCQKWCACRNQQEQVSFAKKQGVEFTIEEIKQTFKEYSLRLVKNKGLT